MTQSLATYFAPIIPILDLCKDHRWVAGGSVTRFLEGSKSLPPDADFDLFATDIDRMKDDVEKLGWTFERESPLAWTYRKIGDLMDLNTFLREEDIQGPRLQIIRRSYPSLQAVLDSFDFTVRKAGFDGLFVIADEQTRKDIKHKVLRQTDGDFSLTVTSLYGIVKYANRGYRLNWDEARKFMKAWGGKMVEESPY